MDVSIICTSHDNHGFGSVLVLAQAQQVFAPEPSPCFK
jgi:hypothetical protein